MKNIVVVLKSIENAFRFEPLTSELMQQGISLRICEKNQEFPLLQDTLYITDSNDIGLGLQKDDLPVLGFFHEDSDSLAELAYLMENPEELDAKYLECVYRRFRDIPWEILETERCLIRESKPEDAEAFFAIYAPPHITKYTEGLLPDMEQQKAYLRDYVDKMYRYYEFGVWTVLSKESGEIIGRAGFSVREGFDLPELGFVIGEKWQGKGIAYEICKSILQYGWEICEFEAVQVLVIPQNQASLNLCRKLGFVREEKIIEKTQEYVKLTIEKPIA